MTLLLEPVERVVVSRGRSSLGGSGLALPSPLLDDGVNDDAQLGDLLPQELALGEEQAGETPPAGRVLAELLGGGDDVDGVGLCDVQPGVVAGDFGAEEDAGRDAGDDVEDLGLEDVFFPFWWFTYVNSCPALVLR